MKAKKSLGQNFLMHARIAERIVQTAALTSDSVVFEIGPGTGMLTKELLKVAGHIVALEADAELIPGLKETFAEEIAAGKLELREGDIRTFHFDILPKGYALVANIPYYLTGEIIRNALTADVQPSSMTLLVQKEVAERIARSKKESLLSLSVKAYGVPSYAFTVPRGAFRPAPNVDSAALTITEISREHFASREHEERFFKLIHTAFAHKRKFVRNNLRSAGFPETLVEHIPEKARAEDLPLETWLALSA